MHSPNSSHLCGMYDATCEVTNRYFIGVPEVPAKSNNE